MLHCFVCVFGAILQMISPQNGCKKTNGVEFQRQTALTFHIYNKPNFTARC